MSDTTDSKPILDLTMGAEFIHPGNGHRYVITHVLQNQGHIVCVLTPIPDGMTAADVNVKFRGSELIYASPVGPQELTASNIGFVPPGGKPS